MVPVVPDSLKVFSGNANPKLAHAVTQYLNIPLGRRTDHDACNRQGFE